ncbi:unnamed protein product [Dibothriocephalus latus]|uniref:Diacylglycerol kinase theta RNA-binding domain-containing protein n=1 Tax=Dibothriocephalus latus TaxID=60516 RepID=A0A3P7NXC5_DIBLA|nr:unnamed protein product [Dibothriocephalus latus]
MTVGLKVKLIAASPFLFFQDPDPSRLRLSMVSLNFCVSERILEPEDRPWELLNTVRQESCRALQLTRFCLRYKLEPRLGTVYLFVGNLKENLSECAYERLLAKKLGDQLKWDSIETIYYESVLPYVKKTLEAIRRLVILLRVGVAHRPEAAIRRQVMKPKPWIDTSNQPISFGNGNYISNNGKIAEKMTKKCLAPLGVQSQKLARLSSPSA